MTDTGNLTATTETETAPGTGGIEVKGLTAGYGGLAAVRTVTFTCPESTMLALIGPNGAGKTTILNALVGLIRPMDGDVLVEGKSICGLAPHKVAQRGVAIIPSNRGVFPNLTVGEHLRLAQRSPSRKSSTNKSWTIDDALGLFPSLTQRRDVLAGNLSGGQRQQLAITLAVLLGPRILLIDELSLGLAPTLVQEILKVLRQIVDTTSTAVVLVEQHYGLALALADWCVVMNHGEVAFQAPAREVLQQRDRLASVYLAHGE
jgi:branched-chain amino acid transport system ATP-binding protein